MPEQTRIVSPGPQEGTVRGPGGEILTVPKDWILLPPGDAGLTRRVKAAGPTWTVQERRGRKIFSRGVFAPKEAIDRIRQDLVEERDTPAYAKKRAADVRRREQKQVEYTGSFFQAVVEFLAFAPQHRALADHLATAVTDHATPVGSGTVARTERIPIERRAEAAVIAWMRHQTTAYDEMAIARIKGQRREVRRMLAERSRRVLDAYRKGTTVRADCPLQAAFSRKHADGAELPT